MTRHRHPKHASRRAATLVVSSLLVAAALGMAAFALDVGRIALARARLQAAADAAALEATAAMGGGRGRIVKRARQTAARHDAALAGTNVQLLPEDVYCGTWDAATRGFTPTDRPGNAVLVVARTDAVAGDGPGLLFGWLFDRLAFTRQAAATAMAVPRDIVFVVDVSGSMNDDTEPCWATDALDRRFAADGHPAAGTELAERLYDDFGYGPFPGELEYVGAPAGVGQDRLAYARLTEDGGPLAGPDVPQRYRILPSDSETARKRKAYSAIIDNQIARLMPAALPAPDSAKNYAYWEKYLDYLIEPVELRASAAERNSSERTAASANRGRLPPVQDGDRIDRFDNPNPESLAGLDRGAPRAMRNRIGYRTYVQFMLDHGRDLKPDGSTYTPLSRHSLDCPWHEESTAGGVFSFPPRTQPMHAVRRALIAALQTLRERNRAIADRRQRDRAAIVAFDSLQGGGPLVEQPLTADYDEAMLTCTRLQAVGDKGAATATEAGLVAARRHIEPAGGQGRASADKVIVLLTDGAPDLYVSDPAELSEFIAESGSRQFYGERAYALDAPLVQAMRMQQDGWRVYAVGIGRAADYDFLDRMARLGGTADGHGRSPRGTENPSHCEDRLTEILREIIVDARVQLVE